MNRLKTAAAVAACAMTMSGWALAQSTTMTGTVSDQMCGAKHMMDGGAAKCTRECVKMGSPYALIVGNKVYTLKGHATELDKLAGEKVTVTGSLAGTTLNVSTVAAAK